MPDLMLITTLDVVGRNNNREHHAIKGLRAGFDRVTVVYRKRGTPGRHTHALISRQVETHMLDGVKYVGVDPILNPVDGAVRRHLNNVGKTSLLRSALGTAIDRGGILRDRFTISGLAQAAREHLHGNATVVEAFGPWASLAAERLRKNRLIRGFVYIDRDYEPGFMTDRVRRAWAERCEARAAGAADLTLCIGHRLAQRFDGLPGVKVLISPTGVDADLFTPVLRTVPNPDLIFVGEVEPWSGIEEAIDAVGVMRRSGRPARLTVFGPCIESYRKNLERKAATSGLSAFVEFRGGRPRNEVVSALEGAGIGLAVFRPHPLRIHAAPLKIWEYMASGLPVLALDGSEAGDIVSRFVTGLACAPTPEAIATTTETLLSSPYRYAAMSLAGPKAAARHDWSKIMASERKLLEDLLAKAPASETIA